MSDQAVEYVPEAYQADPPAAERVDLELQAMLGELPITFNLKNLQCAQLTASLYNLLSMASPTGVLKLASRLVSSTDSDWVFCGQMLRIIVQSRLKLHEQLLEDLSKGAASKITSKAVRKMLKHDPTALAKLDVGWGRPGEIAELSIIDKVEVPPLDNLPYDKEGEHD